MKIIIDSKRLHSALANVSANVADTKLLPIFKYAKFKVGLGVLEISTTSQNGILNYDMEVHHEGSGTCYIDFAMLRNILAILPQQPITLEDDEKYVTLKHATGRLKLAKLESHSIPEERFFTHPEFGENKEIILLKASVCRSIIKNLKQHTSRDELRPAMTCIYLHGTGEGINAVATDAHTLGMMKLEHKPITGGILLNKAAIKVLEKMTAKMPAENMVDIRFETTHHGKSDKSVLSISGEEFEYSQKNETYKYPDYLAVFNTPASHHFTVNRAAFLAATNRVSGFFFNAVLDFEEKGKISIYGTKEKYEGINITEELACEHQGMFPTLCFANHFFERTLTNITIDELTFSSYSSTMGWSFTDEELGLTYLLMPQSIEPFDLDEIRRGI